MAIEAPGIDPYKGPSFHTNAIGKIAAITVNVVSLDSHFIHLSRI
jgi:hypothetical protein